MPIDYQQGKIARIICADDNIYYYVSTTMDLTVYFQQFKRTYKKRKADQLPELLTEKDPNDLRIELAEGFPCFTKKELAGRLEHWIHLAKDDEMCLNHITTLPGKVYKIFCTDDEKGYYYIGSTVQPLKKRFHEHKYDAVNIKYNSQFLIHMNSIGWDTASIELIENYPCKSRKELYQREDEHIQAVKDDPFCLNMKHAHITMEERSERMKEYYQEHRETILEHVAQYREENHELLLQKQAAYREANREKLAAKQREYAAEHRDKYLAYGQQYRKDHREQCNQYSRVYASKNKEQVQATKRRSAEKMKILRADEIKAERQQKKEARAKQKEETKQKERAYHLCECGQLYQWHHRKRHMETNRVHLAFIQSMSRPVAAVVEG